MSFFKKHKLKLNKKGFTLVELVVTLAVLSIVMVCAAMLVGFIAKGYATADELANNRSNVNNCAAILTQEFRRCSFGDITKISESSYSIGADVYNLANGGVTKNGAVIASGISKIEITVYSEDKSIKIDLTSTNTEKVTPFTNTTTIYMRS